ncbi:transposase [Yersinia enterocolitica]
MEPAWAAIQPGVSIAALVREHGINDNLLFNWRQLYLRGKFGIQPKITEEKTTSLLPVALAAEPTLTTPDLSLPPTIAPAILSSLMRGCGSLT